MYIFAGLSKFPIKFSRSNSFPNRKSVEYDEKNYCFNDEWIGFQHAELNFVIATHLQNTCTIVACFNIIWVSRVRVILHSWVSGFCRVSNLCQEGGKFFE